MTPLDRLSAIIVLTLLACLTPAGAADTTDPRLLRVNTAHNTAFRLRLIGMAQYRDWAAFVQVWRVAPVVTPELLAELARRDAAVPRPRDK